MVRRHLNEHWKKEIIQEVETKSTLKSLKALYAPGKVHPIWTQCKHNSNSLFKALCSDKTDMWIICTSKCKGKVQPVSSLQDVPVM